MRELDPSVRKDSSEFILLMTDRSGTILGLNNMLELKMVLLPTRNTAGTQAASGLGDDLIANAISTWMTIRTQPRCMEAL